jgi:hypothetical protein
LLKATISSRKGSTSLEKRKMGGKDLRVLALAKSGDRAGSELQVQDSNSGRKQEQFLLKTCGCCGDFGWFYGNKVVGVTSELKVPPRNTL